MKDNEIRSRLTRDLVEEITKLKGEELEKFMIYCNVNIELSNRDTEETITFKVIDLYSKYQIEKQ